MQNKLILHIGAPKTGTTAIQEFLMNNKILLNKYGYSYPIIQRMKFMYINGSILHDYVKSCNGGGLIPDFNCNGWKDFWNEVRNELKKNNVIISWELMFDYDTKTFFSAIKNEYDNVQIIVYLRRQDFYIESKYNQCVKVYFHFTEKFEHYIDCLKPNYLYKLDILSNIFGKENIVVRVYEKEQLKGNKKDIVIDFMYSIGIDICNDICKLSKVKNTPMFGNMIEIKRKLNNYLENGVYKTPNVEYVFLTYIEKRYNNNIIIKHASGMFNTEERIEFLKQFEEENKQIALKYLGRKNGVLFYEDSFIDIHSIDVKNFCNDVRELFEFFVNKWLNSFNYVNIITDGYMTNERFMILNEKIVKKRMQIIKMLDYINRGNFVYEDYISKCLDVVGEYTPFIVDIYNDYYNRFEYIKCNIYKKLFKRKLVFFGTGEHCFDIIRDFELVPDLFLDNNKEKQGSELYGKKIIHPSEIKNWKNYFLIITVKNSGMCEEIEKQLKSYRLEKNIDYIDLSNILG